MASRRKRAATPPVRNKKQKGDTAASTAVAVVDDAKVKAELRALFGPKNPNYQFPNWYSVVSKWEHDSVFVWDTSRSLSWKKKQADFRCRGDAAFVFGVTTSPFGCSKDFTDFFGTGKDWLPVEPLVHIILDYISLYFDPPVYVEDVKSNKGNGLFAAYDLEPGTVVAPYVGRILYGIQGGEYCLSHRGLSKPTDEDVVYEKEAYTIDGQPKSFSHLGVSIHGLQVVSYANEPDVDKTENCSIVPVRIPGVAFECLCLVVTSRVNAFDELTFHYGSKYDRSYFDSRYVRQEYKVGRESGSVVPPVSLSFEQTMVMLWMYEQFNPGFFSGVFEKLGVTADELSALVAPLMR